ncbi:hypothetical protein BH09VER1_BH09VER1_19440 [soil metagenome]
MFPRQRFPLAIGLAILLAGSTLFAADYPVIDIPKVDAVGPGDPAWTKVAYEAEVLSATGRSPVSPASLFLAWSNEGLLVKVISNDRTPFEAQTELEIWSGDSVEVFVSFPAGEKKLLQFLFSPGRTSEVPLFYLSDRREKTLPLAQPDFHVEKSGDGFELAALIPWKNFAQIPREHDLISVQVYVNDATASSLSHRFWFPEYGASADPSLMYRVRLGDKASPPQVAVASIDIAQGKAILSVFGAPSLAGQSVIVESGDGTVASGVLAASEGGESRYVQPIPANLEGQPGAVLKVSVGGSRQPDLVVPDVKAARKKLLSQAIMVARGAIFDGTRFPTIDFLEPALADLAFGPYRLDLRYFDAAWKEVTSPSAPGRYGAVVRVTTGDGLADTQYITLFKTPKPYLERVDIFGVRLEFPESLGLPPSLAKSDATAIADEVNFAMRNPMSDPAVLVASLYDAAIDPKRNLGFDLGEIDDEWWYGLRQKIGLTAHYKYKIYLPDGYERDPGKSWPLLISLHGSGERGDDLKKITTHGVPLLLESGKKLPFIVVAPQCPSHQWWVPAAVMNLVGDIRAQYRVDSRRIYLTGLSMGGYGTWATAARYPGFFAAIAPVCGGALPEAADRLAGTPAWVFHGDADPVVPLRLDDRIVAALKKVHSPVKYTVYPGVQHDSWTKAYNEPGLYDWFLQHSLKEPAK